MPRVVTVGRLDFMSEGLLLLTNDGGLARQLELPANGWTRRYRARVHGAVDEAKLAALANGITIEGVHYGAIEASIDRQQRSNAWLDIALAEGKNREVRKRAGPSRPAGDAPDPRRLRAVSSRRAASAAMVEEVPTQAMESLLGVQRPPRKAGLGQAQAAPEPAQAADALMLKVIGGKHRGRAIEAPEGRHDAADLEPRPRSAVQYPGACQLARRRHLAADRRPRARRLRRLRRARHRSAVARRRARHLPRQRCDARSS